MPKVKITENQEGTFATIYCPGCGHGHSMPVRGKTAGSQPKRPSWEFDMNLEEPTFHPSLSVNRKGKRHHPGSPICHSWIKKGRIQFLKDSTHHLSGQTVDLPDYPEEWA